MFNARSTLRRSGLFDRLGLWMLALAAITLLSYQPLDSLGHVAAEALEAGNNSLVLRAVAAFDVLDDTLDHTADRDHSPVAQQQVIIGLPCCAKAEAMVFVVAVNTWAVAHFVLPPNLILSELFRPPQG
ncbi:MAG: hypothetical protein ACKORF_00985 [Micrococcales bacterium]